MEQTQEVHRDHGDDMSYLLYELIRTQSPSGFEKAIQDIVRRKIKSYGKKHHLDSAGNVWCTIGKAPKALFTAHMDCVHRNHTEPVEFEIDKKNIMSLTKECKQTALGADDKVGVRILLHMIEKNIPGTYIFTTDEEVGCIGAAYAAKSCPEFTKHAICFDRKGDDSVITSMSGGPCCHSDFADAIIKQFKSAGMTFKQDKFGSTTDTNKFRTCTLNHTNISAGYAREHSKFETLDLTYVGELMKAVVKVNWEDLPLIKRPNAPVYNFPKYNNYNWQEENVKTLEKLINKCFDVESALKVLKEWSDKERYISTAETKVMIKTLIEINEFEIECNNITGTVMPITANTKQ